MMLRSAPFQLLLPAAILLAALVLAPRIAMLTPSLSGLRDYGPYLVVALGVAVSAAFQRGRSMYALLTIAAVIISVPLLVTYLDTGLVPRFPTAILATGMVIVAVLSFFAGLKLDTVTRGRREVRRLAYLAYPAPSVAER